MCGPWQASAATDGWSRSHRAAHFVRITSTSPRKTCTFTNELVGNLGSLTPIIPTVPPIPPTTPPAPGTAAPPGLITPPTSPPGTTPGVPGGPTANLTVTKHANQTTAKV